MQLTVFPFTFYHASPDANPVAFALEEHDSRVLVAISTAVGTPQALSDAKGLGARLHVASRHPGQCR